MLLAVLTTVCFAICYRSSFFLYFRWRRRRRWGDCILSCLLTSLTEKSISFAFCYPLFVRSNGICCLWFYVCFTARLEKPLDTLLSFKIHRLNCLKTYQAWYICYFAFHTIFFILLLGYYCGPSLLFSIIMGFFVFSLTLTVIQRKCFNFPIEEQVKIWRILIHLPIPLAI